MKIAILLILLLICLLIWVLVAKMIRFNFNLVMHPEEKKLLSLEDIFPNKTVALVFRILTLGSLGLLVFLVFLAKELSLFDIGSPVLLVPGIVFFFLVFALSIIQAGYVFRMIRKNGLMPVFIVITAMAVSGIFTVSLLYLLLNNTTL